MPAAVPSQYGLPSDSAAIRYIVGRYQGNLSLHLCSAPHQTTLIGIILAIVVSDPPRSSTTLFERLHHTVIARPEAAAAELTTTAPAGQVSDAVTASSSRAVDRQPACLAGRARITGLWFLIAHVCSREASATSAPSSRWASEDGAVSLLL